jgi:hypothetical protein
METGSRLEMEKLITSVKRGCVLMNLARSSFYYKTKTENPDQKETETDLRDGIEAISTLWVPACHRAA